MKKTKIFLTLLVLVFAISGCTIGDVKDKGEKENVIIEASELPEESAEWTEISQYTGDVDGDGVDENVVLKTSAEKEENGEIVWDDSQKWLLYVEDRTEKFVLLNDFIQIGNVYFEVLDYYMEDGARPYINVIISTGTGFKLKNYSFNSEHGGYEEKVLYDTDMVSEAGTNRRFSSIPDIN